MANALKKKLDSGGIALCLSVGQARTVDIAMIVAASGFDAMYVDLQHTATSIETASMLCAAAHGFGLTPLVRVPSHDPQYMTRVLDTGAMGIVVPNVNTAAQARTIVDTCRFPPLGHRSIVGPNAGTGFRPMPATEMVEFLNREQFLIAMVETPEAIRNADEIASVEGIHMLLIGSYDLTAELGILGQFQHQKFRESVRNAALACRKSGKVLGIAGIKNDIALISEFVGYGVRFISPGTEATFLMDALRAQVTLLRSINVAGK